MSGELKRYKVPVRFETTGYTFVYADTPKNAKKAVVDRDYDDIFGEDRGLVLPDGEPEEVEDGDDCSPIIGRR